MEALSVNAVPVGEQWQYEPKWDGFRCLVFRDGDDVELQSKAGQPLARYFPELVAAVRAVPAQQFVLDGEIVVPEAGGAFSFDALLQRVHPAASRIRKLSVETPGLLIVFDLLVDEQGKSLVELPLSERRPALEKFAPRCLGTAESLRLSPATTEVADARRWLSGVGATLDGIIAKRLDLPYSSGDRAGMQKIKNYRSADCVVGGFRYATGKKVVGSLLLGLYGDDGLLHHVGFTSSFKASEKAEVTKRWNLWPAAAGLPGAHRAAPAAGLLSVRRNG